MLNYKSYNLPNNPGCYLYKDKKGAVIYVGKAKILKKRVASYFNKKDLDYKTKLLVKNIADMEFIVTDTEVEALLLEAKLIRQHKPKFNIDLKESERYAYIKITDEEFPRIITARQKTKDGQYFGPFTDAGQRKNLLYLANRVFKIRTCKKLPKNVCLNYHIGLCFGPCEGKISADAYLKNIEKAKFILKGKDQYLIKSLTNEMKIHSMREEYEKAREIRDQIFYLKNAKEKQKVSMQKTFNQDVINYFTKDKNTYIQMFNITKGVISGRKSFKLEEQENLDDFIKQYYYYNDIPQEIILPKNLDDEENIEKYLSKLRKTNVTITIPQKGTKQALLDLVLTNLKQNLSPEEKILFDLKDWLNLAAMPSRIECFDISNLQDQFTVGSMVHFFNGAPDKNNYRRFKIRGVVGQNDFSMIAEIVRRRYFRLKTENQIFPDLIIIDGGKGQLNAAINELEKLELKIPIISIAKKFEEIYEPGVPEPKRLKLSDPKIKLLQKIRDEAHRFAIKYHRLLREHV